MTTSPFWLHPLATQVPLHLPRRPCTVAVESRVLVMEEVSRVQVVEVESRVQEAEVESRVLVDAPTCTTEKADT